jgi:stage IV sporulation protein FB
LTEWRLQGIRVRIHLLFWAVIGISIATGYFLEILTLFVIVVIHELGHVAVARELGWRVSEIQLLPFGGVATVEEAVAAEPIDEIVIALAGPFMNIAMVFLSLLFWWGGLWTTEWTHFFVLSNFLIAGFNLLPIWPLDGGRIVQALLCCVLPYRRAALLSLGTSCFLSAVMLGLGCYFQQLNVILLAMYLTAINAQAFFRFPFQFIRFLMEKYIRAPEHSELCSVTLAPSTTAIEATQQLRRGCYHLFYIKGGGMLTEERLLEALLFEHKHHTAVIRLL